MAIQTQQIIDQITIRADAQIEVGRIDRVIETNDQTGEVISVTDTLHRHTIPPGADLTNEAFRIPGAIDFMRAIVAQFPPA